MSVLVASDLDRTLIYSAAARALGIDDEPVVCVEVHAGEPTSFIPGAAAAELAELAACATFVPVTTRTREQYERVEIPALAVRYAVVANGGMLLVDGTPDAQWKRTVARELARSAPLREIWAHVAAACDPAFTVKLRNAADLFCYAVVRPAQLPAGFVAELAGWAAARGWRTSLQGRKLYWVPDGLRKGVAVAEVASRVGADLLLAAGDSLLDEDLLLAADRAIRPRHGELHEQNWTASNVVVTSAAGIAAATEIARWFSAGAASAVQR
jgi:hypothetical protein